MASERSESKTNVNFEILDQENLYLDTNEAKIDTLKFWPLRGHGGHYMTSGRSWSKTNVIFEIPDPKNLYLDTHEAKIDT